MRLRDQPVFPVPSELEGYYSDPQTCTRFVPFMGMTRYEYVVLEYSKAFIQSGMKDREIILPRATTMADEYFDRMERMK